MHRTDPHHESDDRFRTGTLRHLVAGNAGRLLDPRRTPVRIVAVREDRGEFVVEILDFEDRGAQWTMTMDMVDRFQFASGARSASEAAAMRFAAAAERFARPLRIDTHPARAAATAERLEVERARTGRWLDAHGGTGDAVAELQGRLAEVVGGPLAPCPAVVRLFLARLDDEGLAEIEAAFATQWVSNPHSGELVKGHRIVIAEDLGLAPFDGTVVRDPALFAAPYERERRAAHVLARLAFLDVLLRRAGHDRLTVYRGACLDGPPDRRHGETFVATSLDVEVAWSCFGPRAMDQDGLLARRRVPVDRVFLSCLETVQLNRQYRESEVVLLADDADRMPLF